MILLRGEQMNYTCKKCGENRFFYVEVSVKAKQRLDLKEGARHSKIYDVEPDHIDSFFEDVIYCSKCNEQVDMSKWQDYEFN